MRIFDLLYADDAIPLVFLVAIFFIVGANMADAVVRPWGWRAAAFGYVAFVLYAATHTAPTCAADLAYIAYRALFAGGIAVGTVWMGLAIVLFFVRELRNVEQNKIVPPQATYRDPEADQLPTDWKPRRRDFRQMAPEDLQKYQMRSRLISRFEQECHKLLKELHKPSASASIPLSVVERGRLQTQLGELQLARQFFEASGEPPEQLGQLLAECDAEIRKRQIALASIPEDRRDLPPQLEGRAVYDEAVARLASNPAALIERARYLISQGLVAQAIADADRSLKLLPGYYAAYEIRGLACLRLGKYSAATRNLDRSIYENPEHPLAYIHLAETYNATSSFREAIGPASYVSVTNPDAQQQLAIAYERLQDHEKAIHHLTLLIQCDPNGEHVPDARVRRALQLRQVGHIQLAMYDLKTQLARRPGEDAQRLLAQLENLSAFKSPTPCEVDTDSTEPSSDDHFRMKAGCEPSQCP